jgi:hypothetical protein
MDPISITKIYSVIKLNCLCINYKLSWRAYQNKLKTTYEHIINCFHKFFETISQVFLAVELIQSCLTLNNRIQLNRILIH